MIEHIDLTVGRKYVSDWSVWEGIREIIQNSLDRERETEEGKNPALRVMSDYRATIDYDESSETLTIENANTSIERRTLILGEGSKAQGGETIGQHGEGYKLAIIALLRCGRNVTVYNAGEVWKPEFVMNESLGVEVLRINFENASTANKNLQFVITNVLPSDWDMVATNVRRLHDSGEEIRGDGGWLLADDSELGRLYVGGLFVNTLHERFLYGYDFDPSRLHLDRDRSTVDSFNVAWECGKLMNGLGMGGETFMLEAVKGCRQDMQYAQTHAGAVMDKVNSAAYMDFREQYGDAAIPVTDEDEAVYIRTRVEGAKPVVIGSIFAEAIKRSKEFGLWRQGLREKDLQTPEVVLRGFLARHQEQFPQILANAFSQELIDRAEAESWRNE